MFNVTVLRLKDIKKYLIGMILTVIIIVFVSKYFLQNENNKEKNIPKVNIENTMIECLGYCTSTITSMNEQSTKKPAKGLKEESIFQSVLKTQVSTLDKIKTKEQVQNENKETKEQEIKEEKQQDEKLAETQVETQIVTNNPIVENYNSEYGKVKIKNETDYQLTQEILTPNITIENENIILFHTHSCESYTSSEKYPYTPTGNFRTTDLNYSVTRVGTEFERYLNQYGINVNHDTSYHDYPAYNGSYTRSLTTVENILKTYPSDIIIDLHRDAIGSRSDYAPIVKIGDEDIAAQIMFVIRNR